jgi:hypothetical protein
MSRRASRRERVWRAIVARSGGAPADEAPAPAAGVPEVPGVPEGAADFALLERWRAGEPRAGAELCGRHLEALRRFFATKCCGDARELAGRTLLAAARAAATPVGTASFRGYLYGLARRELHAHLDERRGGVDLTATSIVEILATGGRDGGR